jgi:hypothetical protein
MGQLPSLTDLTDPYGVVAHPTDATKIYVSQRSAANVLEINPQSGEVLRTFSTPGTPEFMCILSDGSKLYVSDGSNGRIYRVRLSDANVLAITTGSNQRDVAVVPGDSVVYATTSTNVHGITTSNDTNIGNASGGTGLRGLSVAPDAITAWMADESANLLREWSVPGFFFTGTTLAMNAPKDVVISPTGKSMYAVGRGTRNWASFVLPSKSTTYEFVDSGIPATRIVMGPGNSNLYMCSDQNGEGNVYCYQGTKFIVNPADDFYTEHGSVYIDEAVAGPND